MQDTHLVISGNLMKGVNLEMGTGWIAHEHNYGYV